MLKKARKYVPTNRIEDSVQNKDYNITVSKDINAYLMNAINHTLNANLANQEIIMVKVTDQKTKHEGNTEEAWERTDTNCEVY